MATNRDPSPEEIAELCLLIQQTWTAAEKLRRLRVDLRPAFTLADGRQHDIDAKTYADHHSQRQALQAWQTPAGA